MFDRRPDGLQQGSDISTNLARPKSNAQRHSDLAKLVLTLTLGAVPAQFSVTSSNMMKVLVVEDTPGQGVLVRVEILVGERHALIPWPWFYGRVSLAEDRIDKLCHLLPETNMIKFGLRAFDWRIPATTLHCIVNALFVG